MSWLRRFAKILMNRSILASGLCLLLLFNTPLAQAISQNDLNSINNNTPFFDPTTTACGDSSSDSGEISIGAGTDTAKWATTLQPPYSLEDFMVEALNDLAGRENVPTTDTVTQQHVLALVAFAWGEGGNLTNDDIWNPLNSGGAYPGIDLASAHSTSGVQSYATFNDGVDELARIMSGTGGAPTYQTRLGAVLMDPNSTAQDFIHTLTYYQDYKDNLEWATASLPPNQTNYYNERLDLVTQTMDNYKDRASTQLGPPGNTANQDLHSPHALRYSFSGDNSSAAGASSTDADASSCGATSEGVVQGNIAQTAINLAWDDVTFPEAGSEDSASCNTPDPASSPSSCHHGFQQLNVGSPTTYTTQAYQDAVKKYNSSPDNTSFTDCGVFVSTVMRSSGADPDYPASGTSAQLPYVTSSSKYTTFAPGQWTIADLQPGDILVANTGGNGHTYIYVGKQADGYSVAEASQGNHSPEIDHLPYLNQGDENFTLARLKS
jgi:hypothetical protein